MMLSIVIPVYNEKENIINQLNLIKNSINYNLEVLIVYDFDEDNTIPVVNDNIAEFHSLNIVLIKNDMGPGITNAIKKGLYSAQGEYILVLMADLCDDLVIVDEMLEKMNQGFDIVCGSRFMKGGGYEGEGLLKKYFSKIACLSLYFISGIPTHDATNNFKIYRKSMLKNIKITSNASADIALEITVKAFKNGYKVTEIPYTWIDRTSGKTNFKLFKWIPNYLKWYLYCIFKPGKRKSSLKK